MKVFRRKKKVEIHPILAYVILILITILFSGFLRLIDIRSTYYRISPITFDLLPQTESIISLFSLSGVKYIFTNTVANFANFTVLSNLIILLMGISILDKSGFLQTIITLSTKRMKKTAVTFIFVLLCVLSSIVGDLSYLIFIPLGALLFYYGKRNPAIGIISSFAALSCGSGINILLSSLDSELLGYTNLAATTINGDYRFPSYPYILIMLVAVLIVTYLITYVTENVIAKKLPKYEFTEAELEEDIVTKDEKKGMIYASVACGIYILIIIYNIIPGLPLSGALLDRTQVLYIDKLFNASSFFSHGFVFIITILFVIAGFAYGIGVKSIKNHKDFCTYLGHSLDGIGNMLVMIFLAATFISIFKRSNVGNVFVAFVGNFIATSNFNGIALLIAVFVGAALSTLLLPGTQSKWLILSSSIVPTMMNSEMTPAFAQVVYRFGEISTMNITPLLAYFIVYLAFLEKYNQGERKIKLSESIKYQLPYTGVIMVSLLVIIIIWYVIGLPLGINSFPTV